MLDRRSHSLGRPLKEPLVPYDDDEQRAAHCENNVEACDALLGLLIKHHPEHERPHKMVKDR